MERSLQADGQYRSVADCVRSAHKNLAEVKILISRPTRENADKSGDLLREVEVQLGCAAVFLGSAPERPDPGLVKEIHELKRQTEFLVALFGETNRFLSAWAGRVLVQRNGYTERGAAAPLFLVPRTSAEA